MADETLKMQARMENFISKEMDRIVADLERFKKKGTEAAQKVNKENTLLKKGMKSLKGGIGQVAAGMALGTLAADGIRKALRKVVDVTKEAIDTNVRFEKTLSRVKAILRPTAKEFNDLTSRARELGESTVFTASQVGEAFVEMGKLGQEANEIIAGSAAVLDLAALSATDMATAATTAVQTLNQFNLTAEQTEEIVDIMAKSFNTTALDMTKFTNSMKFVGAIGGSTGESVASVTAALGAMADSGIEASLAGTSLRRIMLELADSTSKASKVVTEYDANAETLAEKFQALRKANLDVTQTTDMFGLRATTAAQVLIRNADQVDRLTRSFEDADGVAKEFADTMLDNVAGATIRLESAQEELALSIGESLIPLFRGYKEGLIGIVKWLIASEKASQGAKFAFEDLKIEQSLGRVLEITLQQIIQEALLKKLIIEKGRDSNTWLTLEGLNGALIIKTKERLIELEKKLRLERGLTATKEEGLSNILELQIKKNFQNRDLKKEILSLEEAIISAQSSAARDDPRKLGTDRTEEFKKGIKGMQEQLQTLKALQLEAQRKTIKELSDKEKKAFEKAKSRFIRQQQDIQRFEKEMADENFAIAQRSADEKDDLEQQVFDAEKSLRDAKINILEDDRERELAILKAKYTDILSAVEGNEDAITILLATKKIERDALILQLDKEAADEEAKIKLGNFEKINAAAQNLGGSLINLSRQSRLQTLADERAKIENMNISEGQRKTLLEKAERANKDSARKEKGVALIMSGVNTALAVTKALSSTKPPLNFVLAALVGAAGAVQLANIASAKFQDGGIVGGNRFTGDNIPIKVNSGELVLNKPQQSELFNLANGNGATTNTNNNTSALQLTINIPGGGTVDPENTNKIVESMQSLNNTLLEASRGGYLNEFVEELKLEL